MHLCRRWWDGSVGHVFGGELADHRGVIAEILAVRPTKIGIDLFA